MTPDFENNPYAENAGKHISPNGARKPMPKFMEYVLLTIGTLAVTIGIYFFKYPNNFATGGLSGISVIVGKLVPFITPSQFVSVMNVVLLALGFAALGKSFGIRTVYCSLLMSALLGLFERFVPLDTPLTTEPLLELCFAVFLPAIGSAVVFNYKGSTGGTDIVAMLLKKIFRINVGQALFVVDVMVVIGVFFIFGAQTGLFSLLGLLAKTFIVDTVIDNINMSKYFIIVTDRPEDISKFIKVNLHRGITEWDVSGGFTGQKKTLILTALNRSQATMLRSIVKQNDPHAFVLISNTSDIIGKGFRELP